MGFAGKFRFCSNIVEVSRVGILEETVDAQVLAVEIWFVSG